ncbi:hypothetical protein [Oceanirhabdus sp. W0125-5]|uniref:hypothetical protein n=1 Tax=Oceanirhabdus sp. W0125-5 TaxID=2999116 RepID=UPI0022F30CFA|nr:hypothetical protein [Oceanirhabdus sp. W0125-5]WBW97586.1 hypothetical protein OW730_01920 [Oceanirhabdus sp. W0125-5]
MEDITNNANEQYEFDYKAEYEKLIAEQSRTKVIEGFKGAVSNKGLFINEDKFSQLCGEYDEKTLESFTEIINAVEKNTLKGRTPASGESSPMKKEIKKSSFNDYINNK